MFIRVFKLKLFTVCMNYQATCRKEFLYHTNILKIFL